MKRLLYLIHRWVGIALALFMFVWFTSGLIIMYAGPSALSPAEQLAHRDAVNPQAGWLSLGDAWKISAVQRAKLPEVKSREGAAMNHTKAAEHEDAEVDSIVTARLVSQAEQPLWLVENSKGQRFALSARDGSLHETSAAEAAQIASSWIANRDAAQSVIKYLNTGPQDSSVRNLEAIRPFHRFAVGEAGRELLISARTGEVARDSTPFTRGLYWTGNWIHLLRPIEAISDAATRRNVQIWSGFFAIAASLTGLIIGWQRWRPGWGGRRTYSEGRNHPYRDVWNTWHFWVGLIGGSAALLWAFSGYLSTNPFQIFSPANPDKQELTQYRGEQTPAVMLNWRPTALDTDNANEQIVELAWRSLGEQAVLLGITRDGDRIPQTVAGAVTQFSELALLDAATRLSNNTAIATYTLQTAYDSYYYPRHHQNAVEKALPVLRVDLADKVGTRLYLDPQDGRLLLKQDASRRVYRWLYSALHHWDFGWLYYRPIWDLWMLPLVLMGVVLGGTSVVLGWKRLQIEFKPKKKKKRAGVAKPARPIKAEPTAQTEPELAPNLQSS
ncbi:MAG: peptidase [Verrucomicrobiaceae bacterium]|nr:peptidase [Verrucomicrobiaceae bacterium]